MVRYPKTLTHLIHFLRKLPGVGQKSAERFSFQLIQWKNEELNQLASLLSHLKKEIIPCSECGCFLDQGKCQFCEVKERDRSLICVVSSVKDVYALEHTHIFNGLYHVIPKLLSPLDGDFEKQVNIPQLLHRLEKYHCKEVIIALDSTLEGDATALFIKSELEHRGIAISRLAFGLPLGSTLDFVDEGTLNRAFLGRQPII